MATSNSQPPLAERIDIHKSCKSFETLLSVFNDYCEAAGAVVTLQKKMAKALKETAGMKVTGEIAANALHASATIFEALSEVDSKFAKLADKEYDAVSGDVKKWFKKLAKEEKAHDERISIANAKIKQAGLIYEKKSKKSARDASEEHARYINLISAMGPEISQEKYNHSLQVTERHATTTYNVAASVSRLADAEWIRSCESVRRFAPSIGGLTEWRAYCEGGWTGPVPADLKDIDMLRPPSPVDQDTLTPRRIDYESDNEPHILSTPTGRAEFIHSNNIPSGTDHTSDAHLPNLTSNGSQQQIQPFPSPTQAQLQYQSRQNQVSQQSIAPSSFDPPRKFTDGDNTGSVRSLSQFPAPPTHFPLPPPLVQRQSSGSSSPAVNLPLLNADRSPGSQDALESSSTTSFSSPLTLDSEKLILNETVSQHPKQLQSPQSAQSDDNIARDQPPLSPAQSSSTQSYSSKRGDHPPDIKENGSVQDGQEVTRTASNRSIVAAMKNRYSYTSGSASPPPKDIPRLPLSVNDLATRYQYPDSPSSSRSRPLSPNGSRTLPPLDTLRQGEVLRDQVSTSSPSASHTRGSDHAIIEDERRRQQQRFNQLAELEIQGRERELRMRGQEIELRSQELEREKAMLISRSEVVLTREPTDLESIARSPQPALRVRDRHLSFQQPQKSTAQRHDAPSAPFTGRPSSQYSSASTTNLIPPPPSSGNSDTGRTSPRRDGSQNSSTSTSNHAPYCGCENCSASKYKMSSPLASPVRTDKERPKGWMRRLSMPIVAGNAFLDSKKNKDSGYGPGKGVRSLDSKANTSTTGLRTNTTEEGRFGAVSGRRSYDAGGVSNRSMTRLGLNARQ
ncbi:hypothetical protein J3R30DRAFT_3703474 [Lentinula aciculospora]|uniref:Uncharacterized protein n=1 Tax=Lentinula aciculospora TaxID=153920 RepID=A0A9W9DND6_9AGAR|nr:hypothetical protein J3R30DRAFT_3703474 [Lentinula aciculospora]